ncbi:hypothetical protein KAU33_00085, partial [Candidatus Dependentiae bacterium]|nr:hypothetical protein [Candidatus Dependentiae bacterium]
LSFFLNYILKYVKLSFYKKEFSMKKLFLISCLVLIVFVSSCVVYLDTFEPVLESLWSAKWITSIGEAGTGDG